MNQLMLRGLIGALILQVCAGCASLQSVSVTNIPRAPERARPIEAKENNVAFLGIHFDNDFADAVPEALRAQCPNGKVTGIYSKYETKWYVLVENRSVTAHGYCVPAEPPPAGTPAAPVESARSARQDVGAAP
ncbi:MAG: hypothetical protein ABUL62_32580 [Myxococcales bacterium]|jgi:hypothetical protein